MNIDKNNGKWQQTLYKLTEVVELAESLGDRELINKLLLLLLLLKYSNKN